MAQLSRQPGCPSSAKGSHVSNGDRVYYSFTVFTTTGFGDYTVTVIGVMIGPYVSRRR